MLRVHSTQVTPSNPGEMLHANRFAGWMSYSAFLIDRTVLTLDDCMQDNLDETFINSTGISEQFQSRQRWGLMAGDHGGVRFRKESAASRVEGDARIAIDDLAVPMVDVLFSDIRNQGNGSMLPGMVRRDLRLTGGTFADAGLTGQFYGPDHEEVGGVFERDNMSGAFGASR